MTDPAGGVAGGDQPTDEGGEIACDFGCPAVPCWHLSPEAVDFIASARVLAEPYEARIAELESRLAAVGRVRADDEALAGRIALTDERLAELQRLSDAATPGPWVLSEPQGNWIWPHICNTYGSRREDADFIAAARTAVPELIGALAAAVAAAAEARARFEQRGDQIVVEHDQMREMRADLAAARAALEEAQAENERLTALVQRYADALYRPNPQLPTLYKGADDV